MLIKNIKRIMSIFFCLYGLVVFLKIIKFSFFQNIGITYFCFGFIYLAFFVFIAIKINDNFFIAITFFSAILIRLFVIFTIPTQPISDFELLLKASYQIANNSRHYLSYTYYQLWSYQLGFCTYQALILKLFSSVNFLKFFNMFWSLLTGFCIYNISIKVSNKRVAKIATINYLFMLPVIILTPVLTNQFIATALFYLGLLIWLNFKEKILFNGLLTGFFIGLGHTMRPIGSFLIISILVHQLILFFNSKNKVFKKTIVTRFSLVFLSFFLTVTIISSSLVITNISPDGLSNNNPLWKFVLGTNHDTLGGYSNDDALIVHGGNKTVEERNLLEMKMIKQRLSNPVKVIKLFINKIGVAWASFQPTSFTFTNIDNKNISFFNHQYKYHFLIHKYKLIERAVFYLMIVPAWIFIFISSILKEYNDKLWLLMLILGAYVSIHLLIEVQPRYFYFIFGFISIFFALSVDYMLNYIKHKFPQLKDKI